MQKIMFPECFFKVLLQFPLSDLFNQKSSVLLTPNFFFHHCFRQLKVIIFLFKNPKAF